MPLVSIIIPVYNTELYLAKCLDSVINQTLQDIEIICVNDGSTDNSLSILEEYSKKDNRIIVINQLNKGPSDSRNAGLKIATSPYIGFVDSDDYIEPETYEVALNHMKNNDVDIVFFGNNIVFDEDSNSEKVDLEYYAIKFEHNVVLSDAVLLKTNVAPWGKLYKKSIIDKYRISFPVGLFFEDFYFYWSYMLLCKSAYFDKRPFYNYLIRGGSTMNDMRKMSFDKSKDHLLVSQKIYDFWVKNNILTERLDLFLEIFKICFVFVFYYSEKNKEPVLKLANELIKDMKLNELYKKDKMINALYNEEYYRINSFGTYKNMNFIKAMLYRLKIFKSKNYPS